MGLVLVNKVVSRTLSFTTLTEAFVVKLGGPVSEMIVAIIIIHRGFALDRGGDPPVTIVTTIILLLRNEDVVREGLMKARESI